MGEVTFAEAANLRHESNMGRYSFVEHTFLLANQQRTRLQSTNVLGKEGLWWLQCESHKAHEGVQKVSLRGNKGDVDTEVVLVEPIRRACRVPSKIYEHVRHNLRKILSVVQKWD